MKGRIGSVVAALGLVALVVVAAASPAQALSLQGSYFAIGSTNTDVEKGIDNGVIPGLVSSTLTPGSSPTKISNPPQSVINDLSAGQIQWWTSHNPGTLGSLGANNGVTSIGTRTDTGTGTSFLPTSFGNNFFAGTAVTFVNPAGADGGANGYLSVHWTGTIHVTGTPTLTLGADDDAWLFVRPAGSGNYSLLLDDGGVKAAGATVSNSLTAGDWDLQLFWADRNTVQAGLTFTCTGNGECTDLSPVPEPATLLLLGSTLVGLGSVVRRRMRGAAKTSV